MSGESTGGDPAAVARLPTDAAVGVSTDAAVTHVPTDAAVTRPPTDAAVTRPPTDAAVMRRPTDAAEMHPPIDAAVTRVPTDVAVGAATGAAPVADAARVAVAGPAASAPGTPRAPVSASARITPRGWVLFGSLSLVWGVPYLLIAVAVDTFSPPAVVAARTLGGAVLLLPLAIRAKALRPAWRRIGWVLLFGAIEMAGPFVLLGHAEQTIPSGLTGLLVATVPLFATLFGVIGGDRSAIRPLRLVGLALGFCGVAVVVGGPGLVIGTPTSVVAVGEVLLVAVCYATAPFIVARKLQDVPALGTVVLSLGAVGLFYLPIALLVPATAPPTAASIGALVGLAVLCTALAFLLLFALIGEVGPVRAPLITYGNTVVAIVLGVIVLGEPLTPGLVIGFPIVLVGCWLAATGGRLRPVAPAAV